MILGSRRERPSPVPTLECGKRQSPSYPMAARRSAGRQQLRCEAVATEQVRTRSFAALAFASCAFVECPISETIHDLSNDWRTARGCHRANLVGDVVSM